MKSDLHDLHDLHDLELQLHHETDRAILVSEDGDERGDTGETGEPK